MEPDTELMLVLVKIVASELKMELVLWDA